MGVADLARIKQLPDAEFQAERELNETHSVQLHSP
jgi:hypothetical protein